MNFSDRLILSVTDGFYCNYDNVDSELSESLVNVDKNNIYDKFIVIDITKDSIEIPIICQKQGLLKVVQRYANAPLNNYDKIVCPLYANGNPTCRRTADTMIKDMFRATGYKHRIRKVTTSKGTIFYGGKGIILDEDKNPLLVYSGIFDKYTKENGDIALKYSQALCRVSYRVFLEDNIINKAIIKKIIPILSSRSFTFISALSTVELFEGKVKIIVGDIDNIISPVIPGLDCNNEAINNLLCDNVDELVELCQ